MTQEADVRERTRTKKSAFHSLCSKPRRFRSERLTSPSLATHPSSNRSAHHHHHRHHSPKLRKVSSNKNSWSPSHYVPTSFILSLSNFSSTSQFPSSKSPSPSKTRDTTKMGPCQKTKNFKNQAKQTIGRIFTSAWRPFRSAKSKPASPASPSQTSSKKLNHDSNSSSVDSKPKISYPMKLCQSDLNFVTTQDPWEISARLTSLRLKPTHSTSRTSNHRASFPGSFHSRRLSGDALPPKSSHSHKHTSRPSVANSSKKDEKSPTLSSTLSTSPEPQKSQNHPKALSDDSNSKNSKISLPHPRGSNRGSMCYHHPPLRPLSLSRPPRRSSLLASCDENTKQSFRRLSSPRNSIISSNQASTNLQRQSWATGRPILASQSSKRSELSIRSDRSSVLTTETDRKSTVSSQLPVITDWAGVIEEDVTLTLMGCPKASSPQNFDSHLVISPPSSFLPTLNYSLPPRRPLSLSLPTLSEDEHQDSPSKDRKSKWFSELMDTVEQTLSNIEAS